MASSDTAIAYVYAPQVIAAGVILPVVVTISTALRFVSRTSKKHALNLEDWLLLLAAIFICGMGAIVITGAVKGVVGYPTPMVDSTDPDFQVTGLVPGEALLEKLEYAFYPLMILAFGLLKIAVLFFYRRLFAIGHARFSHFTWIAIGFSACWTVAFFLAEIFGCDRHFTVYWGPLGGVDGYTCVNGLPFLLACAATDFASDVLIFLTPIPLIWQLHMSTKKRWLVTGVLLLGSVSLIASAIRLALHVDLNNATYATKTDIFLSVTLVLYWSMIEAGLAMIAVNLPVLTILVGLRPVQSVIGSIRSIFSLHSIRPRRSEDQTAAVHNHQANTSDIDAIGIRSSEASTHVHSAIEENGKNNDMSRVTYV